MSAPDTSTKAVAETIELLRFRADTRNTGSPVSSSDRETMGYYSVGDALSDASTADLLSALMREMDEARGRSDELELALKPFAEAEDSLGDKHPDRNDIWESAAAMELKAGDLRRAKQALSNQNQEGK